MVRCGPVGAQLDGLAEGLAVRAPVLALVEVAHGVALRGAHVCARWVHNGVAWANAEENKLLD